jgi:hypothetical protein
MAFSIIFDSFLPRRNTTYLVNYLVFSLILLSGKTFI